MNLHVKRVITGSRPLKVLPNFGLEFNYQLSMQVKKALFRQAFLTTRYKFYHECKFCQASSPHLLKY